MSNYEDEIISEISDIPEAEIPDLIQLIRLFKGHRKEKKRKISKLDSWRGGLKDLNYSSVDLQHEISNMWRKKYVSD